jgi:hypothetical protein
MRPRLHKCVCRCRRMTVVANLCFWSPFMIVFAPLQHCNCQRASSGSVNWTNAYGKDTVSLSIVWSIEATRLIVLVESISMASPLCLFSCFLNLKLPYISVEDWHAMTLDLMLKVQSQVQRVTCDWDHVLWLESHLCNQRHTHAAGVTYWWCHLWLELQICVWTCNMWQETQVH